MEKRSNLIDVGRIGGVFGVKGWVKVHSSTDPVENIFKFPVWWLKTKHGVKSFEVEEFKHHNGAFVVHFKGVDDREKAASLNLVTVAIERSQLPDLSDGDYYWDQLIGLSVVSYFSKEPQHLGQVSKMLETGANDVLVVAPTDDSIDDRERLIPYVPDMYVCKVDLASATMDVDWDPEF